MITNNNNNDNYSEGTDNDNSYSDPVDCKDERYLFGDYTPFDENKNFINMLKDFTSISSNVVQIHRTTERLRFVLDNAEVMQNEIVSKIKQFKDSSEESMNSFYNKYHEGMADISFTSPGGEDFFFRMKNALIHPFIDMEREYVRCSEEYRKYIQSKIIDSYKNVITLLHTLLAKDIYNLPSTLTSTAVTTIDISIEKDDDKPYRIYSTTTMRPAINHYELLDKTNTSFHHDPSISYSFLFDTTMLDFWRHKRKVSDLEIEDISIPVGFKTSISERLKRSFRFVSGGDNNKVSNEGEPEFINIDKYHIVYLRLQNSTILSMTLAYDPSKLDDKVIKIDYELPNLDSVDENHDELCKRLLSEGKLPKIDYIEKEQRRRLNFSQKEYLQITDIQKILILGKTVKNKISTLLNHAVATANIKIESIRIEEKDVVKVKSDAILPLLVYNEHLVIEFLDMLATGFAPLIKKITEKSPVRGELILRHEIDARQREEFVVRIEELTSQLCSTEEGKKIADTLGLNSNTINLNDTSANTPTSTADSK
jgi:hypothetical protein